MSCNYAEGLSPYENKGKLGLAETFDSKEDFDKKIKLLSEWIDKAKHVVLHTGAGISTSAGIPDFRGPNGVWTLEKKGIKPKVNISFDDAVPTVTHMAILELVKQGKVHYVVSQNIDGLHLRSGLSRKYLAELHGNMYVDQCNKCERQFVRKSATNSVGQKNLNIPCPYRGFRPCRGTLHDTILDWEHNLPQKDINMGDYNSSIADLSICLGTTLQINPSGLLPTYTKKYNQGKLVICNLSSTKHDKKADLFIRGYVDDILSGVMKQLNLPIPQYDGTLDPAQTQSSPYQIEWTLSKGDVSSVKRKYEEKMRDNKKRKKESEEDAEDEGIDSKDVQDSKRRKKIKEGNGNIKKESTHEKGEEKKDNGRRKKIKEEKDSISAKAIDNIKESKEDEKGDERGDSEEGKDSKRRRKIKEEKESNSEKAIGNPSSIESKKKSGEPLSKRGSEEELEPGKRQKKEIKEESIEEGVKDISSNEDGIKGKREKDVEEEEEEDVKREVDKVKSEEVRDEDKMNHKQKETNGHPCEVKEEEKPRLKSDQDKNSKTVSKKLKGKIKETNGKPINVPSAERENKSPDSEAKKDFKANGRGMSKSEKTMEIDDLELQDVKDDEVELNNIKEEGSGASAKKGERVEFFDFGLFKEINTVNMSPRRTRKSLAESATSTPGRSRKSIVQTDELTELKTPTRRTRTSSISSVMSDGSESGRVTRRSCKLSGIKLEDISESPIELLGRRKPKQSISSVTKTPAKKSTVNSTATPSQSTSIDSAQNNTSKQTPAQNNTPKQTPAQNNTPKQTPAQNNTPKQTPGQNNTPKQKGQNNTPRQTPGQNNTPKQKGQNNTPKQTPAQNNTPKQKGQNNTPKQTPGQNDTPEQKGQNNTPKQTPGQNKTPKQTPGQNNTPKQKGQNNTPKQTPAQNNTPKQKSQNNTPKQTPGQNNTSKQTPGQNNTPKQTPGQNNTSKQTPGQNNTPKQTPGQNKTPKQNPGQNKTPKQSPGQVKRKSSLVENGQFNVEEIVEDIKEKTVVNKDVMSRSNTLKQNTPGSAKKRKSTDPQEIEKVKENGQKLNTPVSEKKRKSNGPEKIDEDKENALNTPASAKKRKSQDSKEIEKSDEISNISDELLKRKIFVEKEKKRNRERRLKKKLFRRNLAKNSITDEDKQQRLEKNKKKALKKEKWLKQKAEMKAKKSGNPVTKAEKSTSGLQQVDGQSLIAKVKSAKKAEIVKMTTSPAAQLKSMKKKKQLQLFAKKNISPKIKQEPADV
ncbi:hypothetical protein M8J75_015959 [Diaphorina citri]|nr:hypothetical protein M8J75_015959 [Diaphorina citri]